MKETYFVTGISTDVGKTVASALITQALGADYWKPIQAGELENTDLHKLRRWVTNTDSKFHDSAFNLNMAMSPHAAAELDGVDIALQGIKRPKTRNDLVIEGAGGLLVPFNEKHTIADLILPSDKVIVVSMHYLGSINHSLLTIQALRQRGLDVFGIFFIGEEHPTTESIIEKMTGIRILGRMELEPYIDQHVVAEYADKFKDELTRKG